MPSTYLKEYIRFKDVMHDDSEPTTPVTPRTSKSLWGNIKKAVNEVVFPLVQSVHQTDDGG